MAKKKIIQLPSGCLSYSQVSLWLADKKRYKEIFFNNNEGVRFMNDAMEYGKIVADAIMNKEETGDLMTDTAISLLPKYDVIDQEMKGELKTKDGYIPIISHPDMFDSKTYALREIKTGTVKWTQNKADNWFQIKFYSMLIYIVYGKVPPTAHLDWIETYRDENGKIKPTGRVETFEVKITLKDILKTMALITKVAKEIESEWVTYVPPPEIPF